VAVDDVSLDVADGTLLALLGPNGAGKTTTVRMLSGLLAPSHGSASVAGCDVAEDPAGVRARVGLVTDVPGLYEQMSPDAYLQFFGRLYGLDAAARAARIDSLLGMFDLAPRRRERMVTFSRGMQQKVALARALLHEPSVLFLDEPTAGLDPLAARAVRELILSLKHARRSIILCTHDLDEAERLADQVAILQGGRILALDAPEVLRQRASPETHVKVTLAPPFPVSAPDGLLEFRTAEPAVANPKVIADLVAAGGRIVSVTCSTRTLEDVYATAVTTGDVGLLGSSVEDGDASGSGVQAAANSSRWSAVQHANGTQRAVSEATDAVSSGQTPPVAGNKQPAAPDTEGQSAPSQSGGRTEPNPAPSRTESNASNRSQSYAEVARAAVEPKRVDAVTLPGDLHALLLIARRAALESLNDRLTRLMNVFFVLVAPLLLLMLVIRPVVADAGDLAPNVLAFYLLVIGMMPAVGAVGIAAGQFAGERERGVLTPMLASPASNLAIFGGKVLGSILPPIVYTLIAEAVYLCGIAVLFGLDELRQLPPGLTLGMLLLVPAATCFAAIVGTLVSSRVRTYNAAQQIAGILLIPLWAGLFAMAFRLQEWGDLGLLLCVGGVLVLDAVLTRIAAATWRREEVLSQR
jgi:ABC-2 type transport system ATP-binding protein